jgi:hypothetical protein
MTNNKKKPGGKKGRPKGRTYDHEISVNITQLMYEDIMNFCNSKRRAVGAFIREAVQREIYRQLTDNKA